MAIFLITILPIAIDQSLQDFVSPDESRLIFNQLLSLLPLSKNLAQKKKEKKNLSIVIERTLLCNEIITIQYKLCMYVYGRRFFCSI